MEADAAYVRLFDLYGDTAAAQAAIPKIREKRELRDALGRAREISAKLQREREDKAKQNEERSTNNAANEKVINKLLDQLGKMDLDGKTSDRLELIGGPKTIFDKGSKDSAPPDASAKGPSRLDVPEPPRSKGLEFMSGIEGLKPKSPEAEMYTSAATLGWSAEKLARFKDSLINFGTDLHPNVPSATIDEIWHKLANRAQDTELARKASQGDGPNLFAQAGNQTRYNDCTIFALANACGLPYGVVAARATTIVRDAGWRKAAERESPQQSIESRGLMGGEVLLLAETFGRGEIVRSSDFAKSLKEGQPVLACVKLKVATADQDRSLHQVVLARTFQHDRQTWYEMIDSNQRGQQRLYVSAIELDSMLYGNGIAFRAEANTTPQLLRKADEK
jgi:hypothetical protein